jgi:molybdopterin converting factor small subunit
MKVYLKVFATLVRQLSEILQSQYPCGFKAGSAVEFDLPEQSSVGNLIDRLDLREKGRLLIFVNGKSQQFGYLLSEGDQIGIFPPIGGG